MQHPPVFRWIGGKAKLAPHLIDHIPYTKIYCEPYGGAASVLINRRKSPLEVYNDIDGRLVNLFRILQVSELVGDLQYRLDHTLYARAEFGKALQLLKETDCSSLETPSVELAWAFFVAQNMGYSGKANSIGEWGTQLTPRANMMGLISAFRQKSFSLKAYSQRMLNVTIDNRDSLQVIKKWDTPETTFYLDPPYIMATRKNGGYNHEVDDAHHVQLVETLLNIQGTAVLSGYFHELYKPLLDAGWLRKDIEAIASSSGASGDLKGKSRPRRVETILVKPYKTNTLF